MFNSIPPHNRRTSTLTHTHTLRDALPSEAQEWIPTVPSAHPVSIRGGDAVIPNTLEAELKAEKVNQQVAAWCLYYWTKSNPSGTAFYWKLANRVFNQVLLHEVIKCMWDSASWMVTSPNAQSDIAAIAEFENQDWV
jgi:hypothetical protein